jgi:hypothetical protein
VDPKDLVQSSGVLCFHAVTRSHRSQSSAYQVGLCLSFSSHFAPSLLTACLPGLTADDEKKNTDMGVSDDDESGSEYDSDDDEMPGLEEKAPEPEPVLIPSIEWKNQGNVHYKVHHTIFTNPRLIPASRSGSLSHTEEYPGLSRGVGTWAEQRGT